jgi:hypothetical protein
MTVPYIGKAEYCYSNSTAMLLASAGEQVAPSRVEVLTGMGIGAFIAKGSNSLLFDCFEPDKGISRALTALGFGFDEINSDDPDDDPFGRLEEALKHGPVILGPLDFGLLVYNLHHEGASGSDHYVLAYDMDESKVYLHDPWGFPCVSITHADLKEAWKAEAVGYKRGNYRHWSNPNRIETSTEDEVFERALVTYRDVYGTSQSAMKAGGFTTGPE